MNPQICTIDGCQNPVKAKGWCAKHHQRWLRHGDPLTVKKRTETGCQAPGCQAKSYRRRTYCHTHYYRFQRYGDPNGGRHVFKYCTFEGCHRPHRARGLCGSHYNKLIYLKKKKP